MRSIMTLLVAGTVIFTATQGDAFAKKDKAAGTETALVEITETGTSADNVFMAAKAIHDTLNGIQTDLQTGNDNLTSALGLTQGTPLADALADLKTKAGDKLTVAMDGGMPKLSLADGAPDNVKAAVDSANSFVAMHVDAIKKAKDLVPQAQEVAAQAAGLDPASLAKEVATNPMDIPKVMKAVANDIKAVTQTPKRIDSVVGVLTTDIDTITALTK